MTRPKLGQCILVTWVDIHTDHSWAAPGTPLGIASCQTVGFVTTMDDESITLAACTGTAARAATEQEVNLRMCLPWGCVRAWTPLKLGKSVSL